VTRHVIRGSVYGSVGSI